MNVKVRRATAVDAAHLAELARRVFVDTFGAQNTAENMALFIARTFSPELQLKQIEDPAFTYLIAEVDGRTAGFALVGETEFELTADFDAPIELLRFYVDSEWHGRGVAQALMSSVEEEARLRGGRSLWLGVWEQNGRAIRFYEKMGFRDAGTKSFILGDDVQTDRVMVRDL